MSQTQPRPTIDRLLNLVPDSPSLVFDQLRSDSDLASAQDAHGYSLVHAAASYGQLDLLRSLVKGYGVSPNIADEDGETPLFTVETVEVAKCLVQELGSDATKRNSRGQTAEEKIEEEGDFPLVSAFLRDSSGSNAQKAGTTPQVSNGTSNEMENSGSSGRDMLRHAPPLPENVSINVGTVETAAVVDDVQPDPEFRRRIEDLAAKADFRSEASQAELRNLVKDAVSDLSQQSNTRDVRQREN